MGDGRYYTFYQFFSTIILVFLAMFIIGSMGMSYYRNKEKDIKQYILAIFSFLGLIVILRVVECVIPNINIAYTLKYISLVLFIVANCLLYYYLFVKVFHLIKCKDDIFKLTIRVIASALMILGVITRGSFLIESYDFLFTQYSAYYLIIIFSFLLGTIATMCKLILSKIPFHSVYKNENISLIIFVTLIFPLSMYILTIVTSWMYLDFLEFFIYFIQCLLINISIYSESEFGLTSRAFNKIGDMVGDFIFVTDFYGNIIYKNQSVIKSNFFTKKEVVNIAKIAEIYDGDIKTQKSHLGKEYIRLIKEDSNHYFTHKSGVLKNDEKVIGYIITITEITKLMNLLHYLEDRKEKSKEANLKLDNYSKVVYNLEKEKEINVLLEEIISSRESDMEKLILMIDKLKKSIDNMNFENLIDEAISYNSEILENVRRTVSVYRRHLDNTMGVKND